MKQAIILRSCYGDWEMFYLDGKIVEEGHTLNEGEERVIYFAELAEKHDFKLKDIKWLELTQEDSDYLEEYGASKVNLTDWSGDYK